MLEMLPQQLLNGIILGGMYALLAVGLTLIFGLMHVLNIAHGEVITLAAFAAYYIAELLGLTWALGLVAAVGVGALFGLVAERVVFRRFAGDPFSGLIVAFGLSVLIQGIAFYVWKGVPRFTTSPLDGVLEFGSVCLSHQRILVFALTLFSFALLYYFLKRTQKGKSIRASAQNSLAASLMGISAYQTYRLVFVIGSALAGFAAALLGSLMTIGPFFGASLVMKGFVVVVLGGMGYVPGALAGGLILGLVESLGAAYLSSAFMDGYGFILLIVVLLFRPKGLFGAREIL